MHMSIYPFERGIWGPCVDEWGFLEYYYCLVTNHLSQSLSVTLEFVPTSFELVVSHLGLVLSIVKLSPHCFLLWKPVPVSIDLCFYLCVCYFHVHISCINRAKICTVRQVLHISLYAIQFQLLSNTIILRRFPSLTAINQIPFSSHFLVDSNSQHHVGLWKFPT